MTRQELDLPLQLGPMKVVPYVLGELAYWQEDALGDETTRMLGQGGVRASLPFLEGPTPTLQNELFNLNGLAHKMTLDAEFLVADADVDFERLPLYDPLDDNAIEFFRRRFFFDTFSRRSRRQCATPV